MGGPGGWGKVGGTKDALMIFSSFSLLSDVGIE